MRLKLFAKKKNLLLSKQLNDKVSLIANWLDVNIQNTVYI